MLCTLLISYEIIVKLLNFTSYSYDFSAYYGYYDNYFPTYREYPEYRFHFMHYPRREYLDLKLEHTENIHHKDTDFVDEMLYSLANLHVATQAHGFVGTLSSNWCMMVSERAHQTLSVITLIQCFGTA